MRRITRSNVNLRNIIESFRLTNQNNHIDFEIRTTYVINLLNSEDINGILKFLIGNNFRGNYVLQQYQYSNGVGEEFIDRFKKPEHNLLQAILRPYYNLDLDFNLFLRDDLIGYSEIGCIFNE
jgi:hypothetical protein